MNHTYSSSHIKVMFQVIYVGICNSYNNTTNQIINETPIHMNNSSLANFFKK
jgi:hypothetical protein